VWQVSIGDAFSLTHGKRLVLAVRQHMHKLIIAHGEQPGAYVLLRRVFEAQGYAVGIGDLQKARKKDIPLRPAADRQEVNQLDEQLRCPTAFLAHTIHQCLEATDIAVVANAQQRARRHVAHTGCLDHDGRRFATGKAAIPVKHVLRNLAIFGCAPRHHGRHPRSVAQ
jgi:hypothetical protein